MAKFMPLAHRLNGCETCRCLDNLSCSIDVSGVASQAIPFKALTRLLHHLQTSMTLVRECACC
jgi:hypothetical protein